MTNSYESPFCTRYASKEMQYIFSPDKKFKTWRKLWIALAETQRELGLPITEEQIEEEYERLFALADQFYNLFGLTYQMKLSTRPDDFIGDIETWNRAEAVLRKILDKKFGAGNYEIKENCCT